MNERDRDQQHGHQSHDHKREAPGAGQQQHEKASERAMQGEKPKTEQASHQGGGGVRKDHLPQGK